jgi:glycine dehydrogenase
MLMPARRTLAELEHAHEFHERHIGPSDDEQARMLDLLGCADRSSLMQQVVPAAIRREAPFDLPPPVGEAQALDELRAIARRNLLFRNFIGQGYYGCHTPTVILRNVLENPAWYTAYTPYQPEISQGRLEALLNFQTMVCDLTGMAIANASLLDEATAAAEAMTLLARSAGSARQRFVVAADALPQTIELLRTRAEPLGIEVTVADVESADFAQGAFGVLLQYPGVDGAVRDLRPIIAAAKAQGSGVVVACDLLALCLLTPPGECGADVCVGSTQRFGMPLGYGGPHAAFMAVRDELKRGLPGRLVGASRDSHGDVALRLTLQTREQHIRREKATSNICTAQVLPAVVASMYAVYHGPKGLRRIAERVATMTGLLAAGLRQMGHAAVDHGAFDTLLLRPGVDGAEALMRCAWAQRVNLRRAAADAVSISLDETTTRADVEQLWAIVAQALGGGSPALTQLEAAAAPLIPAPVLRSSGYLTHPVFNTHHSETEMLRYLRALADRDIALDRAMIPLGSCTMKLNATSEMIPVTWPEFAQVHPYAPAEQAAGYAQLNRQLSDWLCRATGYDAISLQPNAGSQGEYAGLLAIRAYHRARGQAERDVCIIPASAHGTNPASAQMVGMRVVVSACDAQGNVDLDDLAAKAAQHAERLAACMITYPSTHGVFEERVREICDIVHRHGGQVYVDGANMNALVGLACPPEFGADVSHLNLHKTFCIPHGGGGPGVGPVAVRAHLAPYLPTHRSAEAVGALPDDQPRGAQACGAISAAWLGNAAVLPISWMYCRMMGAEGLRAASEVAILNANYIAARLAEHYPVLYTGPNGRVAHECILDLRPLKERCGISNEDVAKRLIDYGFHAPTMSFPVPGTLMIEPTESESLAELDRFCDALIAIRAEIARIESGEWTRDDNPLVAAPFTAAALLKTDWPHRYDREQAAFPVAGLRRQKYWPPVGRVDNVWGDRNLQCACLPVEAYR